jgi:hypothetical protein
MIMKRKPKKKDKTTSMIMLCPAHFTTMAWVLPSLAFVCFFAASINFVSHATWCLYFLVLPPVVAKISSYSFFPLFLVIVFFFCIMAD